MRVTVFGRKGTVQKLSKTLAAEGVDVTVACDGLGEMIHLEERTSPDPAIVDGQSEAAEAACRQVKRTPGASLVLTVSRHRTDWRRLQSLGAGGYLPDGAPDWELVAHLRSVLRRFLPAEQTEGGC